MVVVAVGAHTEWCKRGCNGIKAWWRHDIKCFQYHSPFVKGTHIHNGLYIVNSLRPSDAYMRQYNIPTLLQIMTCRLFGAKPLSEPTLPYCQLIPTEHISMKFYSKFTSFHSRRCTGKCRLRNGGHFVSASMCWLMCELASHCGCIYQSRHLIHVRLEIHGWVLSTAATDALVLKHQTISIHSDD